MNKGFEHSTAQLQIWRLATEDRFYGVASATQATMRQVGMMFSVGIAMLLFAVYIGRVQITPEYEDAWKKVGCKLCIGRRKKSQDTANKPTMLP